ncbi:SMI1/KNR4 family protein [Camelimonas abortus]|uniref:SMI1/KNR4 family protein n=1 Tax=Camelimonas abortus TaxID=1017184 RepID=A0ABV7LFN8_9HYPH
MMNVLVAAGAGSAWARRELANCCNGFHNTPPGWIWREQPRGAGMNLVAEDAWRRAGRLGPLAPPPPARPGGAPPLPAGAGASGDVVMLRPVASFRDIGAWENRCGGLVPRDFIEFLRQGGPLAPAARFFTLPARAGQEAGAAEGGKGSAAADGLESLQHLFGFGLPEPVCNLDYALGLYAGAIPAGVAPIGGNGGGDYLCLDLRGGDTAREAPVALWRVDHFWRTGVWREEDFIPVAPSFSGFMARLRLTPDGARRGVVRRPPRLPPPATRRASG